MTVMCNVGAVWHVVIIKHVVVVIVLPISKLGTFSSGLRSATITQEEIHERSALVKGIAETHGL